MLQRFIVHLSLVLLFALTQMCVATHEISHLKDLTHHSQQDKKAPNHQCEQCIIHADIADGLASKTFDFAIVHGVSIAFVGFTCHFGNTNHQPYSARAPPFRA